MNYKSLGKKAYTIGKTLGSRALTLGTLGSKINPISMLGNALINKGVDIASHKLMGLFDPTNTKRIK
jgi:hypothetical protein